jgi:Fic family protein
VRLYSLSRGIADEREAYYAALERAQRGTGDITDWLAWFLGCLERGITRSIADVERVLAKSRFWTRHGGVALSERQRKVLNRMLDAGPGGFEGGITTRKYVGLTSTSRATAQRELADLVAWGMLAPRPGGGRSTSYDVAW